jgi:hypothetical protein
MLAGYVIGCVVTYGLFVTLYFFSGHRRKHHWRVYIVLSIESGQTSQLGLVFTKGGVVVPAPAGASVVWSPITETVGSGDSISPNSDPTTAVLIAGPEGDAGNLTATVTLPNGVVLTTPEFDFTVTGVTPDAVEIVAQA